MIAGSASKYDISGNFLGPRAVRWDPSGTAATELDTLNTDSNGYGVSVVYGMNDSGTAVGLAQRFNGTTMTAQIAVRWDAGTTSITPLEGIGSPAKGAAYSLAHAINSQGISVGWSNKYSSTGALLSTDAVYWTDDGHVVDLNDLIDPAAGWFLSDAVTITDSGWIAGIGRFDPDGSGPLDSYMRPYILQIPEPVGSGLAIVALSALVRNRRQSRARGSA